jgi:hypothetical protein
LSDKQLIPTHTPNKDFAQKKIFPLIFMVKIKVEDFFLNSEKLPYLTGEVYLQLVSSVQ